MSADDTDEHLVGKSLRSGSVLRHRSAGVVTLSHRKEDDTGWWNTDGSGLADTAIASGDWSVTGWREVEFLGRYARIRLAGLVSSCRECGAIVYDRTVHDRWHAYPGTGV